MSFKPRNIKLLIAYDGTDFSGWQRQKRGRIRTIQGEIENCLGRMTGEKINLHGAGRTDRGVHAEGMVANFATLSAISCNDFLRGLNSMLPEAIRIYDTEDVESNFHARFSAKGKHYRYIIYTGKIHPPFQRFLSLHITGTLNLKTIENCLKKVEGTHDFSSFENSGSRDKDKCSGRGAVRTIFKTELILKPQDQIFLDFTGDGFLRNMVRNLVGSLLDAGRGKITKEEFSKILKEKNRTMAGPTASAHGLVLKRVLY